ncbi:type VII toxin-antitoxin system MntA family adenylyltransferase antitoxin [Anaerobacillus isosaccharinicus]|uniref:DNA polymerase subunit beta n=1 Tax=Anaerobacillus isosaccharinicus TaxID=1532552 RepID=A0A1S2LLT1_9BACI|nr:nucleotidyltransferase domain-containing protein [Anaerobacillus isosaccharinicus]MBA5586261.1 nucleotidyltransferase domain-containing protein [Anaerobacillus isosaccharinicus]QOY35487.1 nucleotidyltransferase domain-containing protein [Anaerobacillus isosaccharinicus]
MEQQLESIKKRLITRVSPSLIYLFGSYAKGTEHASSDIDIAYMSDVVLSDYERFMLAEELASELNKDVDLVDLKLATTVFQTQIIATGKLIYCTDELLKMKFEMLTLKMYAKLNEERQVVLDKIRESGEVYETRRNSK